MATCWVCGIGYWPANTMVHNGIHGPRTILGLIDLGEGATPEAVDEFRQMWKRITGHRAARREGVEG